MRARCASEDDGTGTDAAMAGMARAAAMRSVNPIVIPRNHRVEEALAAASEHGDLNPLQRLLTALSAPFDHTQELPEFSEPANLTGYQTFCGT